MSEIHKLKGATIASVKVKKGGYGLPTELILTTTDGGIYAIDNKGEDGGECGHYPCLNFSVTKKRAE